MGSGADRSCDTCVDSFPCPNATVWGSCEKHRFPEERVAVTFIDKVKGNNPPGKAEFSLDKLIDDHWWCVEGVLTQHLTGYSDKVSDSDLRDIRRAEFHYKTAAKHFWKHCCEHYGIEEKK